MMNKIIVIKNRSHGSDKGRPGSCVDMDTNTLDRFVLSSLNLGDFCEFLWIRTNFVSIRQNKIYVKFVFVEFTEAN